MLVALAVGSGIVAPSGAHPPPKTDHGVPESVFHMLWSADNESRIVGSNSNYTPQSAIEQLGRGTDVPFYAPPKAVTHWNNGEFDEIPGTNHTVSLGPSNAVLVDGEYVHDAYTEILAIQPSTKLHISPTTSTNYVPQRGDLLIRSDYRVAVPEDTKKPDRRVHWTLLNHEIDEMRLLVDKRVQKRVSGSSGTRLSYKFREAPGERHSLKVKTIVSVTLERRVKTCVERSDRNGCVKWKTEIERISENVSMSDSQQVRSYDLNVTGTVGRYPDGDVGLAVETNQPWLGYTALNETVSSVWRLFSARDRDWDSLVARSESGKKRIHSPAHPLQLHAFPSQTGPIANSTKNLSILQVSGPSHSPPGLPSNVHLDRKTTEYNESQTIVTRITNGSRDPSVRARGLVRGVNDLNSIESFDRIDINRSNVTLSVLNESSASVTVLVNLSEEGSGTPITTETRAGYVLLNGKQINTNESGKRTLELARPVDVVSARYVPGDWWRAERAYVGDDYQLVAPRESFVVLPVVSRIAILVSLWFVGAYLLDRVTGWRLWPPWRGL